jgi:hypothetical protein
VVELDRQVLMASHKLKTGNQVSRKEQNPPVRKRAKRLGGLLEILRKGGRVRRRVTKITEYTLEVSDD